MAGRAGARRGRGAPGRLRAPGRAVNNHDIAPLPPLNSYRLQGGSRVPTPVERGGRERRTDPLMPREAGMEHGHAIETRNTIYFRHEYDGEHADMRRLYEQAKLDQWNAATDIDWARPIDGDGGLIADDLVDIHGTRFWDRLSEADRLEVNRRVTLRRPSALMQ